MRLEQYIESLLYRHHCVVVPQFGAFLSQRKSAFYKAENQSFYPPSKVISFNSKITVTDGVLVSHIAAVLDCSFDHALVKVEKEVANWQATLQSGSSIDLENIGMLSRGKQGVEFKPYQSINYLHASFGLSSVVVPQLSRENNLPQGVKSIRVASSEKVGKTLLKYAAVSLIAVSSVLSAYKSYTNYESNSLLALEEAQEVVKKNIQEARFFSENPIDFPALSLHLTPQKEVEIAKPYHIMSGSFRMEENAQRHQAHLKTKGYENAHIVGTNKFGLHQVSFKSFSSEVNAREFLAQVRKAGESDAWLLVK